MDEDLFFLDPCPDLVWAQLPGGPVALDDTFGEQWQYTGSVRREDGQVRHEFRHRSHPGYDQARVYAHVADDDAGPRLSRLVTGGRELPLPYIAGSRSDDPTEEADEVADP